MIEGTSVDLAEASDGSPIVDLRDVSKDFFSASGIHVPAVRKVSVQVRSRELVSLVGRSGSGKTTLLHVMSTLERPTSGRVILTG